MPIRSVKVKMTPKEMCTGQASPGPTEFDPENKTLPFSSGYQVPWARGGQWVLRARGYLVDDAGEA